MWTEKIGAEQGSFCLYLQLPRQTSVTSGQHHVCGMLSTASRYVLHYTLYNALLPNSSLTQYTLCLLLFHVAMQSCHLCF